MSYNTFHLGIVPSGEITVHTWYRSTVDSYNYSPNRNKHTCFFINCLNRDDTDEDTLLLSLKLPNDSNGVTMSVAFFRHVLVTTHLFTTNHCEGLDRKALAECESVLRQHVHREYFPAAVECRQGFRQRTNFQARWMAQSG